MASVEQFLTETLKLAVSPEKSGIHAASKGVTFLGYRISAYTSYVGLDESPAARDRQARTWRVMRRPTTGNISLRVPRKEITAFCRRHGYGDLAKENGRPREQFLVTSDLRPSSPTTQSSVVLRTTTRLPMTTNAPWECWS